MSNVEVICSTVLMVCVIVALVVVVLRTETSGNPRSEALDRLRYYQDHGRWSCKITKTTTTKPAADCGAGDGREGV